jgi:asparagine N-glycosylation enzyme membrane subunit Stt3
MSEYYICRLLDFNDKDLKDNEDEIIDDENSPSSLENINFSIQMYALDEIRTTFSINVMEFKPYFYIKVGNDWNEFHKKKFLDHIKRKIGTMFSSSICGCSLVNKRKLYLFDNSTEYTFIEISFNNIQTYNKVKNLWFIFHNNSRKLNYYGYEYKINGIAYNLYIYE